MSSHPDMSDIVPVILCGGSGTRLWPLSRRSRPKQFARVVGSESLFQATLERARGMRPPLVVTSEPYRFAVLEQMAASRVDPGSVLVEPEGRDTAPACLAAALSVAPGTLLLVMPSDHAIPDHPAFHAAVAGGMPSARSGRIVTFGIRPDRPETGFGWLAPEGPGIAPLRRFIEKPDAERAARLLARGCLWNAGLFLMEAGVLLDAARRYAPDMLAAVRAALDGRSGDLGFERLATGPWVGIEGNSVDRAIMERAGNLTVVPYAGAWSDMGDWNSVWREGARGDPRGNAMRGDVTAIDCDDSLLRVEREGQVMVGLGLRDIVAVSTPDAVLIADRGRMQDVRAAVDALDRLGAAQARQHRIDYRPWGHFEALAAGPRFQVKRIVVRPGGILSLQSHTRRSEHWVVVEGQATVTLGETTRTLHANQSVYVPLGEVHRLENAGPDRMVLIEVQTGDYLGEDDIVRHEDAYARD